VGEYRYDPLSPEMLENPYPHYARLRESTPIFWHEGMGSWVLTRYAECRTVLRDFSAFARDRRRAGEQLPEFRQSLQSLDPPEQLPLRRMMLGAFTDQDLPAIGATARELVDRLHERQETGSAFDWMSEVSAPYALGTTAALMGVPSPELAGYREISEGIALRMDAGLCPRNIERGDRARNDLNALASTWFDRLPDGPGVLPEMRRRAATVPHADHYVRNSAAMMFNAGYGTIYAMAGNVVLALLENPDLLERLRKEDLFETAAQELVRYDGPAQGTSRVAIADMEIADQPVGRGDVVMTLMACANRDPRQFDNPEVLDLARHPNRHLGFGLGPHSCLGSKLGHLAIVALLRALAQAPRELRLAARPTRRATATVRSVAELPVRFDPAPPARAGQSRNGTRP
jgi:cytochrome P450